MLFTIKRKCERFGGEGFFTSAILIVIYFTLMIINIILDYL